ncbi:MAG: sulfotransferase [Bacteroidota bacterium]
MKISFLYGADLPTFLRLLWQHRFQVNWRAIPSLILHFLFALFNTLLSLPERFRRHSDDPIKPVFILGHWRSGTTHLHNLMTVDGAYHAPNTFQAAFPHNFLLSESWLAPLLDKAGPGKRLMDNMKMTMDSVQEEEIGLASLGAPSSYLAIHFPKDQARYQTHVSFAEATEQDLVDWEKAHRSFLRKIVAKHGNAQALVLKSPANTSRIPLLLEMYPDARFVHIHRHPFDCIRSTQHLYDAWFEMAAFQDLSEMKRQRDESILDMYEDMHRRWLTDKALIPTDRLLVLGFAELKADPVAAVRKIYGFLGDAKLDEGQLQVYLDSIRTYQQNRYAPLSEDMKRRIQERMGFVFEAFGY